MSSNAITQANQEAFDKMAPTVDDKWAPFMKIYQQKVIENLDMIGAKWVTKSNDKPLRMLDFACGTGAISRVMANYVSECVGLDISGGMVKVYNENAVKDGHAPSKMHAVQGDILSGDLNIGKFDIIACSLAVHHFDDPVAMMKKWTSILNPGGIVFITEFGEWDPNEVMTEAMKDAVSAGHGHSHEEGHSHEHGHGQGHGQGHGHGHGHGHEHGHGHGHAKEVNAKDYVPHNGFSEERLASLFREAGLSHNYQAKLVAEGKILLGMERKLYIARGQVN